MQPEDTRRFSFGALRRPGVQIWLLTLAVLGLLAGAFGLPTSSATQLAAAALLALLLALGERLALDLPDGSTLAPAPALLLAGLSVVGWPLLPLAALAGTLAGGLLRRRTLAQLAHDAGRATLMAALLLPTYLATQPAGRPPYRSPLGLLGLALLVGLAYMAELCAPATLTLRVGDADERGRARSEGSLLASTRAGLRARARALGWHLPALLLLGGVLGALWQASPWLLPLGLAPLLLAMRLLRPALALPPLAASLAHEREQRTMLATRVEHLHSLAAAMIGTLELPTMLDLLCRRLAALLDAPAGWVVLLDERDRPQLMTQHNLPAGELAIASSFGYHQLLERGRVVLVTDERCQLLTPTPAGQRPPQWAALLCIPLLGEGTNDTAPLLGAICLAFQRLRGLDADEKRVLTAFARQAATTVENARLFAELRRKQAELIQSSKLAAVGTFAAGIAHEFNNLLGSMLGYAELGRRIHDMTEKDHALDVVIQACKRGRSITRGLLTFARRQEHHRAMADLTDVIDETLMLVDIDLRKAQVDIVRRIEPVPPTVCDQGQIAQVVLNLITNARDAMQPAGGTLTLGLRERDDVIEISVRDTGCGIPPELRDTIFEPFVTTKGVPGEHQIPGTGLGLSVSYGIVQEHGGSIEVDSTPGSGTTMTVRLPVVGAEVFEQALEVGA